MRSLSRSAAVFAWQIDSAMIDLDQNHRGTAVRRALLTVGICLGLGLAAPAAAGQGQAAVTSSRAAALVELGLSEFRKVRAHQRALPPASSVPEELARRVALEQAGRRGIEAIMQSSASLSEQQAAISALWDELAPIDDDNTRYLKTVLPPDGWFRISRDGEETTRNAWLIVQHSSDREFQTEVLRRMEPLAKNGEVRGGDYALLYDRLQVFAGRPQRYGSQATCRDGQLALHPLEDPSKLDEWRRDVGLGPLEEYKERLGVGEAC